MELRPGDIVLCTVRSIEGTTVFLNIENNGIGSMPMSEVAAGRIRNLREYVAPNKKVVCKVLTVESGGVQLSLRRVTAKEREEAQERYRKEKTLQAVLKAVSADSEKILAKIKIKYEAADFFDEIKSNPLQAAQFMKKEELEQLTHLLKEKGESEKKVKKRVVVRTLAETGLQDIKEILAVPNAAIRYLGSSQFLVEVKARDFKEANTTMQKALETITRRAKEKKAFLEVKEQ
ncbi:hypothetical protein HYZ97_01665 [Candidatus Pacearchaeota archaeon]|nr:hypothetical protein [Candidatus Pacearchaeota archaeon]